jgi:GWxTD domain-containing protein
LYTYLEIYDLTQIESNAAPRITYEVLDSLGRPFEELFTGQTGGSGRITVDARAFNVLGFPSGTYTLRCTLQIPKTDEKIIASKDFRVRNLSDWLVKQENKGASNPRSQLSNAQLEKTIAQVSYLLTRQQKKTVRALDRRGKIRFLAHFWKSRDPNPDTPVNEFQQEFYKRVNYANRHFGAYKLEGWQSDRGRILILYGPPDEIERNRFELDYKPYEIWHYDRLGGRICVFADLEGYGIYTLIHSTFDNEVHDPEWRERIYFVRTK